MSAEKQEKFTLDELIQNREQLLAELQKRQALIRDRVREVALQCSTGLYLFGPPGTAKTHTVLKVLKEEIKEPFRYERGHLTPLGLFDLLKTCGHELVVLDDLGQILKSEIALQILLAALEHPVTADRTRVIKYRRQGRPEAATDFAGGIICVSNKTLHSDEMLDAVRSRAHVICYDPGDAQIGALMLEIADRGWSSPSSSATQPEVTPGEAREVAYHLIRELLSHSRPFDLRLLVNKALPDSSFWKDGDSETHWRDLVTSAVEESVAVVNQSSESLGARKNASARSWP